MSERSISVHIKNATINLLPPTTQSGASLSWVGIDWAHGQGPTPGGDSQSREVRDLGNGEEISQTQALKEVEALNEPADPDFVWRLETPHELFAIVDYGHKNANGAYSRDETIRKGWYWTNQESPAFEGARVVVGFGYGNVFDGDGSNRCFARAVRVARQ